MIAKIKQFFTKRKETKNKKEELINAQAYYKILQSGGVFVKFVQDDLNNSSVSIDRYQRRRMKKTIIKGEFTPELIGHYQKQISRVLENVNKELEKL